VKQLLLTACSCFLLLFLQAQNSTSNQNSRIQQITGSSLSFKMQSIPAGSFLIGSTASEKNREKIEGPQKKIQIPAFWMGAYEVTRDEFDVFLKDEQTSQNVDVDAITRPSAQYVDLTWGMGKEGGYPANSMSQFGALMYCKWLYKKTGIFFRLPTEAEWEYACRAGTNTTYYFGNDPSLLYQYAWYLDNSDEKYQKVGLKKPNPWGLYDMLGNLMEWTLDHYEPDRYKELADNAIEKIMPAKTAKYPKVLRGGSYEEGSEELRVATRFHSDPSWNKRDPQIPKSKWWLTEGKNVGFRLIQPMQQPTPAEVNQFFINYLGK
jgi:formylglycine-generating enzyme required for sulfatase activity